MRPLVAQGHWYRSPVCPLAAQGQCTLAQEPRVSPFHPPLWHLGPLGPGLLAAGPFVRPHFWVTGSPVCTLTARPGATAPSLAWGF